MCFHGARKRFAKDANVEKLHSYFSLQKFAKHTRGFGSVVICSREWFGGKFKKSLKFLANVSRIPGRDLLSKMSKKLRHMRTTCVMFAKSS